MRYAVGVEPGIGVWVGDVPACVPEPNRRGRPRTRYEYGDAPPLTVKQVALQLPREAWEYVTWAEGSKGPLRSRFAAIRVHTSHGYHQGKSPRPEEWLLVEWPETAAEPTDFWLSNLPPETSLKDLVSLAKIRWHFEQDYQQLKDELGLDHFEGRKWVGWHRHVTLTTIAYAFLLLERIQGQEGGTR